MTAPLSAWTHPFPPMSGSKTPRALLVDQSDETRELRAEVMRKVGIEVDCAADLTEARSMWRPDLYSLVLMNVADKLGDRERFCQRLRTAVPAQQMAFLVGAPDYLAANPTDTFPATAGVNDTVAMGNARTETPLTGTSTQQRWGILEASQRISEVRSAHLARQRAVRNRMDRETSARTLPSTTKSLSLEDLVRKELQ
jgi:CheY-like chemotaxis protein